MSRQTHGLEKSLQDYVVYVGAREPDVLARLRAETGALPLGIKQISTDQSVQDDLTLAQREFNRRWHADTHVDLRLVPIGDGVTLAPKLA